MRLLRWSHALLIAGLAAMVIGAIDPIEGAAVILPGSMVGALGASLGNSRYRRLLYSACGLIAAGVGALAVLTVLGGVGGDTGRSERWGLFLLPYPAGWVMGILGSFLSLREIRRERKTRIPSLQNDRSHMTTMQNNAYDLKPVQVPGLRGPGLRLMVALLERSWIASLIAPLFTRNLGVDEMRTAGIDETPTFLPIHTNAVPRATPDARPPEVPPLARPRHGFRFRSIRDYRNAYRSGAITPEQIADRVLAAINASDHGPKPLKAFIACQHDDVLSQARESGRRHRAGDVLSPLDGVPIAVKDLVDMTAYPTTAGTRFLGGTVPQCDSTVVARLRNAGALLIGKTNMHEIGILPDGRNPHYGTVLNPYNLDHETGGSSSGSAAAVAAGLCPAAVGADGGGSIRIPAALCGVVGLKPTFGRVSETGAVPLAWSVTHMGPIAATAEDAALLYAVISGPDPLDANTLVQTPIHLDGYDGSLRGVRIGVYRDWFFDAANDVVAVCERLLQGFVRLGAELVDVTVPDLRLIAVAHGLTIHAEMAAGMDRYDRQHRHDFGLTTRLMLANVRAMRSSDYVQAQRIRTRAIKHFRAALERADVIATPTTPITAPEVTKHTLLDIESNVGQVFEIMRFVNPANLTGLPAISIPSGYDGHGLPIGLQLVGRPWDESTLLRLAYAAESEVPRKKPAAHFDLLPEGEALKEG